MQKLPVGIQTFEKIIDQNCLYVDKTKNIHQLINEGDAYFLSRPRRFGKSLLVSTLDSIFSGKKELFKGLAIYKIDYDWQEYPVLRFDFSGSNIKSSKDLERKLCYQLESNANSYGIVLKSKESSQRLDELIETLDRKKGKCVILVDEYDKPILNNLAKIKQAEEIRDTLKGFYEVMKASDRHVRFRLVTGVSKFSHTSLFSGDNNLENITMSNRFATMLGYTQEELEKYFNNHITELAKIQKQTRKETLKKIMGWYNGYQFSKKSKKVYNPFSTLLLFKRQEFENYWFESGTPSFLLNMLTDRGYGTKDIENAEVDDTIFSSYDFSNLNMEGLFYETGYLTIKGYDENKKTYTLGYPNREVKESLVKRLFNTILEQPLSRLLQYTREITTDLKNDDLDNVFDRTNTVLSGIPHQLFTKYEAHYHSLVHLIFEYAGLNPESEKSVRGGNSDMIIETKSNVYIFEFKTKENKGIKGAFTQIEDREYGKKYKITSKKITHVAIELDTKKRELKYEIKTIPTQDQDSATED